MASETKASILRLLAETHANTRAAIAACPGGMGAVVYPDSGWRVREVVAHLEGWDRVLIEGFRAYLEGREVVVPGAEDFDVFNAQVLARCESWSDGAVLRAWESTHAELWAVLEAIPAERFGDEMLFAWNERGRICDIMEGMAGHEALHCQDILKAVEG